VAVVALPSGSGSVFWPVARNLGVLQDRGGDGVGLIGDMQGHENVDVGAGEQEARHSDDFIVRRGDALMPSGILTGEAAAGALSGQLAGRGWVRLPREDRGRRGRPRPGGLVYAPLRGMARGPIDQAQVLRADGLAGFHVGSGCERTGSWAAAAPDAGAWKISGSART